MSFRFERILNIGKTNATQAAKLVIVQPEIINGTWTCSWSLDILHPEGLQMTGVDALGAFTRVVTFVSNFIRDSETDGWKIYWLTEGDHGGLPLLKQDA